MLSQIIMYNNIVVCYCLRLHLTQWDSVKPRRCRRPGQTVQDATTPRHRLPHGPHPVPHVTDVIPHKKTRTKVKTFAGRSPSMWTPLHCLCDSQLTTASQKKDFPKAVVWVMTAMDDEHLLCLTDKNMSASFVIMNYESQSTLGQG